MEESTCWTMIDEAARGNIERREEFAVRYLRPVRNYLTARWQGSRYAELIEDAVQEVFVACFQQRGVLDKVEAGRPGGFRAYLFGLVRNVARTMERRQDQRCDQPADNALDYSLLASEEASLSRVFDRAYAQAIMEQAANRQREKASQAGDAALRRVELLRLRFQDGLPIRTIARQWQVDAERLHREYAKARQEFHQALLEIVAFHSPGSPDTLHRECQELLALLQ